MKRSHNTTVPRASAGRMTCAKCCARAANTSNSSVSTAIGSSAGVSNSSRMRSAVACPGLSGQHHIQPPCPQAFGEVLAIGTLASAFGAFEGDEESFH